MPRRTKYYEDLTRGDAITPQERSKLVRQNWEKAATDLGSQKDATIRDLFMRELNTQFACKFISEGDRVIDVGCGNGIATVEYGKAALWALGVDYIPQFIDAANDLHKETVEAGKVEFQVGDILDLAEIRARYGEFDVVVSERTIINLADWDEQKQAVDELSSLLKKGGFLILTEVTKQGHESVDALRQEFGLPGLQKHWNNVYLDEAVLEEHLSGRFELIDRENFGVYILLSRVVNAVQAYPQEPAFDAPINEIGFKLAQRLRWPEGPGHHIAMVFKKEQA